MSLCHSISFLLVGRENRTNGSCSQRLEIGLTTAHGYEAFKNDGVNPCIHQRHTRSTCFKATGDLEAPGLSPAFSVGREPSPTLADQDMARQLRHLLGNNDSRVRWHLINKNCFTGSSQIITVHASSSDAIQSTRWPSLHVMESPLSPKPLYTDTSDLPIRLRGNCRYP